MENQNYEYEKVVDAIYWMGFNVVLNFSVVLARSENGYRKSFHQEYLYQMSKYKNHNNFITVKRTYDYFLTIENLKPINDKKEYIIIGVTDFPYFRQKIIEASNWLSNSNIFMYKNNNIVMIGSVDPIVINFSAWNKTITLEPIVMKNEQNLNCSGIRITLGKDRENFCDLSVDKFMGLAYIVESFNMPMAAMNILTYMGKPEREELPLSEPSFSFKEPERSTTKSIFGKIKPNGKPGRFVGVKENINDL